MILGFEAAGPGFDSDSVSGPSVEGKPRQILKMTRREVLLNLRMRRIMVGRSRIAAIPRRKKIKMSLPKEMKIGNMPVYSNISVCQLNFRPKLIATG